MKAQDFRAGRTTGKMTVGSKEFWVTPGATISHSTFLNSGLMDDSYYSNSVLELPGGRKI
jgi:hypothetical protein